MLKGRCPKTNTPPTLATIAHVHNDFPTKFGLPRQSMLVPSLRATVVFAPEYRDKNALRSLDGYSHIWLIWGFSETTLPDNKWLPMVRPPRLGGNTPVGVFASRSPFRPNPLGLSCVSLDAIDWDTPQGPVLHIAGADMMDGTPVYDIKPYLPQADSHPDASGGFSDAGRAHRLAVVFPEALLMRRPAARRQAIADALALDPRPAYQHDPARVYGVEYAGFDVRFTVERDTLTVCEVVPLP